MSDENPIRKALNDTNPQAGAKERMYQHILDKAAQAKRPAPKRPVLRMLRFAVPIAACVCLAFIWGVTHPSGKTPSETVPWLQDGNPYTEVADASGFQTLHLVLDAPADASDVSYGILGGNIACISFTWNQADYDFRVSADPSAVVTGLSGSVLETQALDDLPQGVFKDFGGMSEVTWSSNTLRCCLMQTGGAAQEDVLRLARILAASVAADNN